MPRSNLTICLRRVICAGLFTVISAIDAREARAQTEFFPIDGGGGATVNCLSAGAIQRTGKPFGSYPTTITGCVLGQDSAIGVTSDLIPVLCKGGARVQFYPGIRALQSCILASDTGYLRNTTNTPTACRAGFGAQFGTDGLLIACNLNLPPLVGDGTGGGTGGGTGDGNRPLPPPGSRAPIVVPGETATLAGAGQYTLIGASSNRPGGRAGYLYMGDGRASATYTAQVPVAGTYALWIRFDDDGNHAAGARGVEISVNGAVAIRWNNESRDTRGWTNIPVGSVVLRAGANTIVFTKAATTPAAFVLDEFVLSDQPGFIPQ